MNYDQLAFSCEELTAAMRENYEELLEFVTTPSFRSVYQELMALPAQERPKFVAEVILCREELERRGIKVPEGVLIQTSTFGDRRPTLFVVKKYLPTKYHEALKNINITFFNEFSEADIPNDGASSWRPPLPVELQNVLLENGVDLNVIPEEFGLNYDLFERASAEGDSKSSTEATR